MKWAKTLQLKPRSHIKSMSTETSNNNIWCKEGLKFECIACGRCCTGKNGRVRLNPREIQQLGEHLQIDVNTVKQKYLRKDGSSWLLKQNEANTECVFLENGKKCSIYAARPTQCRTYPWWPQNVISQHDWDIAGLECPGVASSNSKAVRSKEDSMKPTVDYSNIVRNLLIHDLHNSGENRTFDEMSELLHEIDDALVDDYGDEFFTNNTCEVVYRDNDVTIVDRGDKDPSRTLSFNSSPTHVQSELFMRPDGSFDHRTLVFDVHKAMSSIIGNFDEVCPSQIVVIGTGAGALPMYFHCNYPEMNVETVDCSALVTKLACDYFGLKKSSSVSIFVEKGEEFLRTHVADSAEFLMVDVAIETMNEQNPLQAPPKSMLCKDFLQDADRCLKSEGILVMNFIGTLAEATEAMRRIEEIFHKVYIVKLDSNYVFFAAKEFNRIRMEEIEKRLTAADIRGSWSCHISEEFIS